jgi:hypothetical protein
MLRRYETQNINFFKRGTADAKAECLNGKIQQFISNNYGLRDKDFFFYPIAGYFA